jgi:hypothetical protein
VRYELRPLGTWIGPETHDRKSSAQFRAPWLSTLDLIGRETALLGANLVVIQVDVKDGEIRRDGMLSARARVGHPGVRVSFDSRHGPLTYATDAYETWQANVRAIALALTALRAVDRHGVTRRGEQYRGWTAIESGSGPQMSADRAARLLAAAGGGTPQEMLADPAARARAYKRAASRHHPDAGGDAQTFIQITAARDLLDATADLVGAGGNR